jgi:hypothetical protein
MKLFGVGIVGVSAVPGSFIASVMRARPTSLKMVGTSSTIVTTSDCSVPPNVVDRRRMPPRAR